MTRYYLRRYRDATRMNHWFVAIMFFAAALSGLAFFHPSLFFLSTLFGGGPWTRILHPFMGLLMVLGFVFLFFRQSIVRAVELVTGQNLWDPSIRFLAELPSRSDPVEIATISVMALVLSFLATLYPAMKAASTDPVQVLRYE